MSNDTGVQPTVAESWSGPSNAEPATGRLGRYRIVGRLGAGGMGEVLLVRDDEVGREIAAKVLHPGAPALLAQKLALEGQVTGQLEHPHIVPLYECGRTDDGRPYVTMKRVDGRTLAALLAQRPPAALDARLAVFLKVCDALAYAHARGVIHRDLKPANVMVGRFGEVLVMDWGLARVAGRPEPTEPGSALPPARVRAADATLDGTVMGTPAYMPPEQAEGRIDLLDARSDIYSLGAILYELLVLEPPYLGTNPQEVLLQAAAGPPVPPRRRRPDLDIPDELEAVVLRAMARSREERYATVGALQREVEAWQAGRTLAAMRYSMLRRALKWVGRHRTACTAAGLVLGVAVVLVALFAARERQRVADAEEAVARDRALAVATALADAARHAAPLAPPHELRTAVDALRAEAGDHARARRARWQPGVAGCLGVISALDRGLSHAPDALDLRDGRREAALRLGRVALLAGELALAAHAADDAAIWGADSAETNPLRDAILWEADRVARERRQRLEAMLADLRLGLASPERTHAAWGLEDYVLEAVAYRDPETVAILAAALAPLTAKARAARAPMEWTEVERHLATFCCRVLGRLGRVEAVSPLADWLGALGDEPLAVEAGLALCCTATPEARAPLVAFRKKLGADGLRWRQIGRAFDRVPAPPVADAPAATDEELAERVWIRVEQKDFAGAIAECTRVIEREPQRALAHGLRGQVWHAQRDWQAAVTDLTRALELAPGSAPFHALRGMALYRLDRAKEAIADLDQAIARDPRRHDAFNARAVARERLGDDAGAIADYTRALEIAPSPAAFANRGCVRIKCGDPTGGITDLDRALELDPRYAFALKSRGVARQGRGDHDGALVDLTRAIELDPRYVAAYADRAWVNSALRRWDAALADYDAAIGLSPGAAWIHAARARAHLGKRDLTAAHADSECALELDPSNAHAWVGRAYVRLARGDYADALADCERALELEPSRAEAYRARAQVRILQQGWSAAEGDLTRALDLAPRDPEALAFRALARWRSGNLDGAADDCAKALSLDPRQSVAHHTLGNVRRARGDLAGALAALDAAVAMAPTDAAAHIDRGLVRQQQGDVDGAIADYDNAIALDPQLANAYLVRGRAHGVRRDWPAAARDLVRHLEVEPRSTDAMRALSTVHLATGEYARARALADATTRLRPDDGAGYELRGLARWGEGDVAGCIEDLGAAVSRLPAGRPDGMLRLGRGMARLAQGEVALAREDLAVALRADGPIASYAAVWLAASGDRGPLERLTPGATWPGPVVAHARAELSDEGFLERARGAVSESDCELWSAEADAYVGLWLERAGKADAARAAYARCVARSKGDLLEHLWAAHRLRAK